MSEQTFQTVARDGGKGRLLIPVPFEPDKVWHPKPRHQVNGTVNGMFFRGVVEAVDGQQAIVVGRMWARDCGLAVGEKLKVVIAPEGPQRADLAEDFAAALEANPKAAAFFDGLAQFYRRGYLRWIDATKRRPEVRAERIREVVELLAEGRKERPK